MKKYITILLLLFLLSGCVSIRNEADYNEVANNIVKTNSHLYNRTSTGYKYYLPQGVNLISDSEFNQKLVVNNTYMYLYVDIVSYYYKTNNDYPLICENCYYYTYLDNNSIKGYLRITKDDKLYFVEAEYNYAKIQTYTDIENLNKIVSYSLSIISSIDYSDHVIDKLINNNYFSSIEKTYSLIKPDNSNINILEILEEYNKYEEDYQYELPDEKSINNLNN